MSNPFLMTRGKKKAMIHDIMSNLSTQEIKKKYKINDQHIILQKPKKRDELVEKLHLSDDSDLYSSHFLIVVNKQLQKYILDNNIHYHSFDSVIYKIDSRDNQDINVNNSIIKEDLRKKEIIE